MSKIKRLAGETVLYGLGSILPRFLNFLLVRLHTKVFDPEQYGIITELYAYAAVLNTIFLFGMETAYFRFATKPDADEKKVFRLSQTVVAGISLIVSAVLLLVKDDLSFAAGPLSKPEYIVWLTAIMFVDAIVAIPFARLRLQKKAFQFALGKLMNIAIMVGLNVYFLLIAFRPTMGVDFVFLANLIANACYILLFIKTLAQWRPSYDPALTPVMLRYGYPVMLTGLAGMTSEMFSRLTLKIWLPENFYEGKSAEYALGVFGACYKLGMLMSLTVTAFRYAAEPFFFSQAQDKNSPQLFARINHYFIVVCCVLLLGVSINLDILKYFFGSEKYWEGLRIVPILLLAYLFLGVYYNFTVWFKLTDRTYYGTVITIGGAIITILANYILIPVAGYNGSTWATLICYASMTIACYLLGQKYYPIPYQVARGLTYITGTIILVYFVNAIVFDNPWLALSFHVVVLIIYLTIVYFIERKEFRQSLH
jgi:O-antigen/teichoic acid export membrane protein